MINKIDILIFIKTWFIGVLALIAPFYETMMSLFFLVGADILTGIYKVYKLKGYKEINSFGFRSGFPKIVLYFVFILCGVIAEKYVPGQLPFMRVVVGLIIMAEFKSISENIGEALGFDIWKYVRKAINKGAGLEKEKKEDA